MKPIVILYATREGHSRKIAQRLAALVRARGLRADTFDVAHISGALPLNSYSAAMVIASVHRQCHEPEMISFVKRHALELKRMPAAFLSVSLSQAGAEDPKREPEQRAQAAADAKQMIEKFLAETGWRPMRIQPVAGALLYSKYNFLLRFVMKRIARRAGGAIDTSRDYEYTDWIALGQLVNEFTALASSTLLEYDPPGSPTVSPVG